MNPSAVTAIGITAGLLGVTSVVPQVVKVVRTRKTRDLAMGMWIVVTAANGLWTIYGIATHCVPIILSNGIQFVLVAIVLRYKLHYH